MKHTPVEVEVMVPCAEGREHPVRLRIHSWREWELVYTPCEELLGRGFALMAPCSHYVHENSDSLAYQIIQQLSQRGDQAVPLLIEVLHEEDEEEDILYAVMEALSEIRDPQAIHDRSKYVRQAAQEALNQIRARQQAQTGGGTP